MDLEVQDNKTCLQCKYFVKGDGDTDRGACSAFYYDLSIGSQKACEHFEEKS